MSSSAVATGARTLLAACVVVAAVNVAAAPAWARARHRAYDTSTTTGTTAPTGPTSTTTTTLLLTTTTTVGFYARTHAARPGAA